MAKELTAEQRLEALLAENAQLKAEKEAAEAELKKEEKAKLEEAKRLAKAEEKNAQLKAENEASETKREELAQLAADNAKEAQKARKEAQEAANDRAKILTAKEASDAEAAKLRAGMDAKKFVPKSIPGTFKVKLKTPAGETIEKTMKFKDGAVAVRLADGSRVSTLGLMQLAETGEADEQYLKQGPALQKVTQEKAKARLTFLTQIQYGQLEEA